MTELEAAARLTHQAIDLRVLADAVCAFRQELSERSVEWLPSFRFDPEHDYRSEVLLERLTHDINSAFVRRDSAIAAAKVLAKKVADERFGTARYLPRDASQAGARAIMMDGLRLVYQYNIQVDRIVAHLDVLVRHE